MPVTQYQSGASALTNVCADGMGKFRWWCFKSKDTKWTVSFFSYHQCQAALMGHSSATAKHVVVLKTSYNLLEAKDICYSQSRPAWDWVKPLLCWRRVLWLGTGRYEGSQFEKTGHYGVDVKQLHPLSASQPNMTSHTNTLLWYLNRPLVLLTSCGLSEDSFPR